MQWQSCDRCKHESKEAGEQPCFDCGTEGKNYEPKTYADRIRNMSDEELTDRILREFDTKDVCRYCIPTMRTEGKCNGKCKSGILQWLRAEVKEGANNGNTE